MFKFLIDGTCCHQRSIEGLLLNFIDRLLMVLLFMNMSLLDILFMSVFNVLLQLVLMLFLKLQSMQELLSYKTHFFHSSLSLVFINEFSIAIHVLFESHEAKQHAYDCKLSKDTSVHHLELKGNVLLSRSSIENVRHRGN